MEKIISGRQTSELSKKYFFEIKQDYFLDPPDYGGVQLIQLGRAFCRNNAVIPPHVHGDFFELTVVSGGKGIVSTNSVPTAVGSGDIYLSFPCDTHSIQSDFQDPLNYDFIAFRTDCPSFVKGLDTILENCYSPSQRLFRDEKIRTLVGNAIEELNNSPEDSAELLEHIFKQILIYLIRDFDTLSKENRIQNKTPAEILCLRLMNYIDTHIYSLKNLEELSGLTGYSYSYLSTLFKKTTTHSLSHYYHEKKLDIARILVLENEMNFTEIAEVLNYASLYAFSKAFHNRFQMSPRDYYSKHSQKHSHEAEQPPRTE